jgi:hypothetical protein
MSIIAGERSMPVASTPSECRYAVKYPGPQPTSTAGPPTSDANSVSAARRYGCSSRAPAMNSA